MKKLFKTITLTLLFAALLFSVAACSSNSPADRGGAGWPIVPNQRDSLDPVATPTATPEETAAPVIPIIPDIPENPVSDFEYKYNADVGGIEITKYKSTTIRVRIPEMIEDVPVKMIGAYSFKESGVMEVYLPSSVTDIGAGAFLNSRSLTTINIPNGVVNIGWGAFKDCSVLASITIPNSVAEIGNEAFSGCTELANIAILDSAISTIAEQAFTNCTALTSIVIPDSVTEIGTGAFWNCTALTSVVIPNSVTEIGLGAFSDCTALTSIVIPSSVVDIGASAFWNCTALTSVTIPDNAVNIGWGAFRGCTALTSVTIPDNAVNIGHGAFVGCTALTSIVFSGDIRAGFLIQMDGYWWRVLEARDGKALVISEYTLERREYHNADTIGMTWAECSLRTYLNNEFYNSLSADTKTRIIETQVINNNLLYGGADTTDKIFLLSIEETETYFGDNEARFAFNLDSSASNGWTSSWWWLRTPSLGSDSALVYESGYFTVDRNHSLTGHGGVRPAFWINL